MHALIITEQGMQLSAEGNLLVVSRAARPVRRARAAQIDQVLLCGRIEITTGAISLIARRGIDLVWLTADGRFRARLATRASASRNVALRLAQYRRAADPEFCLAVARPMVWAKILHQRELLLRAQRRLKDPALAVALGQLRLLADRAGAQRHLDALRGVEGQAAALYFAHFGKLLRTPEFTFAGRNRRPPRDPVNACLSFGYALLGTTLETELLRAGLEPLLGFFHQPQHGRASLMLDLLEVFRPVVDALALRLLNRRQLAPSDFDRFSGASLWRMLRGADDELDSGRPQPANSAAGGAAPAPAGSAEEAPFDVPPPAIGGGPIADSDSAGAVDAGVEPVPDDSALTAGVDDPLADDEAAGLASDLAEETGIEAPHGAALAAKGTLAGGAAGVYLGEAGRRIVLAEYFKRLRETQFYPPRGQSMGLREIIREQVYHLARVIEGREASFQPYLPNQGGGPGEC